ncbi:MAG: hypothetical protein AUH85_14370 [Chloroflexi bacterium 13_1_40CM_4_68_4]|nr:MAG: hypothetical protein AUH85_14370 [Chloroflexi bacterium 13_1_40CM_4_68_4]
MLSRGAQDAGPRLGRRRDRHRCGLVIEELRSFELSRPGLERCRFVGGRRDDAELRFLSLVFRRFVEDPLSRARRIDLDRRFRVVVIQSQRSTGEDVARDEPVAQASERRHELAQRAVGRDNGRGKEQCAERDGRADRSQHAAERAGDRGADVAAGAVAGGGIDRLVVLQESERDEAGDDRCQQGRAWPWPQRLDPHRQAEHNERDRDDVRAPSECRPQPVVPPGQEHAFGRGQRDDRQQRDAEERDADDLVPDAVVDLVLRGTTALRSAPVPDRLQHAHPASSRRSVRQAVCRLPL